MKLKIVESLLGFTLLGAEWVLWLLIGLSILSLAIIIERLVFFLSMSTDYAGFSLELADYLSNDKLEEAKILCRGNKSMEAKVVLWGLNHQEKGAEAMASSMEGFALSEKHKLDRGLVVLGTLGNNAPFIGLFGTVIGIIQAFNDLAANPDGGPAVVMGSISEALIATAIGLLVAIPAVIAFNGFNRSVKKHMANVQAMIKLVLTHQKKIA